MTEEKFIDIFAKRLYYVVDMFEWKLKSFALINDEVLEQLDEGNAEEIPEEFLTYFKEILNLNKLYEHSKIEKALEELDVSKDDDTNVGFLFKKEHQGLIEQMKKYCFYICKFLKENEKVKELFNTMNDKNHHDFFKFLYIISDMKKIFSIKFQTTAEDKLHWVQNLKELQEEELKIQNEEKRLNENLEKIRKENQDELQKLEDLYKRKEKEFEELKATSEDRIRKLINILPQNETSEELEQINVLFEKTKSLYENQIKKYQDLEISSIKKNSLLELDIKNYIDSIDETIRKKDEEIAQLQLELHRSQIIEEELDTILDRKKKEDAEKQYLNELASHRNLILQKKEDSLNNAATIIQSYVRAIKQRNLFSDYMKKISKKKKKDEE